MNTDTATNDAGEALDVNSVAALLRCSPAHIRDLVREGRFLAPVKLGHLARWSRAAVLAWLREGTGRANGTGKTADRGGVTVQVRG